MHVLNIVLDIELDVVLDIKCDIVCDVVCQCMQRLYDIVGQTYDVVCKHTMSYFYLQYRMLTYDIVY